MYGWKKKCKIMGLSVGNDTIHQLLLADNHAIIAQDKADGEYMVKINRKKSEMGLECKYS